MKTLSIPELVQVPFLDKEDDVKRMQEALERAGYKVSPLAIEWAWSEHYRESGQYNWSTMPEDDKALVTMMTYYLVESE